MTRQAVEIIKKGKAAATGNRRQPLERRNGAETTATGPRPSWFRIALVAGLGLVLALLATPGYVILPVRYQVGEVAEHDIKAVRDFLVTDEVSTERRRQEAAQASLAVYDFDEESADHLRQRLATAFGPMRQLFAAGAAAMAAESTAADKDLSGVHKSPRQLALEKKKFFEEKLGASVTDRDYAVLVRERFAPRLEEGVVRLAESVLSGGVVGNKPLLLSQVPKGIILRSVQSGVESKVTDLLGYMSLADAKRQIRLRATALLDEDDRQVRTAIVHLAQAMLQPNITFNRNETELRKQKARDAVKPVLFQVKKGEMIVREGQRLTEEQVLKLEAQAKGKLAQAVVWSMIGAGLLGALLAGVGSATAGRYIRGFPSRSRDLLFAAAALTILLALAKLSLGVADALSSAFPIISTSAIYYLLPMAAGAMLMTIFFGPAPAMVFAFATAVFAAFVLERQYDLLFYYLIGSLVAIRGVETCRDRSTPLKAGLRVSVANVVVIVVLTMLEERGFHGQTWVAMLFGVAGGLLSGVVTTGLSPLAEMAFGYTTDVKLLELANMDQPLLRELMVQAPGSYHHSLIVGNMVEAAAKSIGANSLLARVAAYYHDIGKIKKPIYFVENQMGGDNRHERLAPSMSSLILISHVKDGVELARKHRLGKAIEDIIQQHHGTSLISYFYQKALDHQEKLKSTKGGEVSPVLVEDYRYPGPKPQTKEAGLVMLADAVEAASRTLTDPTVARMQGMVQKIINKIFSDGQLDECELTLKDLHQIAKSFIQILTGIFHHRVDYPEPAAKVAADRGRVDGDQGSRPAKAQKNGSREDRGKGREDLRRLGMS